MRRRVEEGKTYRIPTKQGTRLLKLHNHDGDLLRMLDLRSNEIVEFSKADFEGKLNDGKIYVSALSRALFCR